MDAETILKFLMSLHPVVAELVVVVGLVSTVVMALVTFSPWKGDDAALEEVKKMPIIGPLLAAVMKFSPLKPNE